MGLRRKRERKQQKERGLTLDTPHTYHDTVSCSTGRRDDFEWDNTLRNPRQLRIPGKVHIAGWRQGASRQEEEVEEGPGYR